ncbi:MAG: hypothetical protein MJY83_07530 [Bacteroidales bacterium]|nr:hypothetical protein [Bacteroidales bacterium]
MKRYIFVIVAACLLASTASAQVNEVKGAFVEQLQKRDSILIADQLRYGFQLNDVEEGTKLFLPEIGDTLMREVDVIKGWQIDTVKTHKKPVRKHDIRGSIVIAPWEEGEYHLPRLALRRVTAAGVVDTLVFDEQVMDVRTMPVDTATFVIKDVKAPVSYPVTFKEVLPYILGVLVVAALIAGIVALIIARRKKKEQEMHKEPAYIVALRKLDKFRGDKFWAPEKQKTFYSGITDALREYIEARFDVDAMEMTTAEIFGALKGAKDITPDLYNETKDLFELADFVKFAKHTVPDEENAKALPSAVRFVTSTYQAEVEEESADKEKEAR